LWGTQKEAGLNVVLSDVENAIQRKGEQVARFVPLLNELYAP
jgi:hypothetical protein